MDGENHGKPYESMDGFGVTPLFWVRTHMFTYLNVYPEVIIQV